MRVRRVALLIASLSIFPAYGGKWPKGKTSTQAAVFVTPSKTMPNPFDLLKRIDLETRGKTLEARILVRIVDGTDVRSLELKLWAVGVEKAMVKVLAPARERGKANLRLLTELWQYVPAVEHILKVAPSMGKLRLLGSNVTNGDLVRSTSLSRHYEHRLLGEEKIEGALAYKIESFPKSGAPVPPGRVVTWILVSEPVQVRQEYYGPTGKRPDRVAVWKNIKREAGHTYPATLVVSTPGTGMQTQVDYGVMKFDQPIPETVFTQEYLKKRVDD